MIPPRPMSYVFRDFFQALLDLFGNFGKEKTRHKANERQRPGQEYCQRETRSNTDEVAVFTIL